jgi:thioredoxin-like negative regulator of GroEL
MQNLLSLLVCAYACYSVPIIPLNDSTISSSLKVNPNILILFFKEEHALSEKMLKIMMDLQPILQDMEVDFQLAQMEVGVSNKTVTRLQLQVIPVLVFFRRGVS